MGNRECKGIYVKTGMAVGDVLLCRISNNIVHRKLEGRERLWLLVLILPSHCLSFLSIIVDRYSFSYWQKNDMYYINLYKHTVIWTHCFFCPGMLFQREFLKSLQLKVLTGKMSSFIRYVLYLVLSTAFRRCNSWHHVLIMHMYVYTLYIIYNI